MQASKVPIHGTDLSVVVQGFKGNETFVPYVFIGISAGDGFPYEFEGQLTPENAHILSEEIRKQAEWANHPAGQGE